MSQTTQQASLEDIMLAMDVVDSLRHQQGLIDRELDTEGRRDRLLTRLKDMYLAQGLDVPEHVLIEGIEALEQERFKYQPVPRSWRTRLAMLWVTRSTWGKPFGFFAVLGALLWGVYFAVEVWPERQLKTALPKELAQTHQAVIALAKVSEPVSRADQLLTSARLALQEEDFEQAKSGLQELKTLAETLSSEYTLRVVSRANQRSGVWRIPDANPDARNYYLIVEAVDRANRPVKVAIVNEENNQTSVQSSWGLRVTEELFYKVVADKQDDGIIQNNVVGVKQSGYLEPEYKVPTSGATITEWK